MSIFTQILGLRIARTTGKLTYLLSQTDAMATKLTSHVSNVSRKGNCTASA
jgi:hypothetical protein